ncbi:MAG: hypothetical protein R3C27_08185 [Hyphomonadaceae bacterium]
MTERADRFVTLLLFTFVGPFMGTLAVLILALSSGGGSSSLAWEGVPSAILILVMMGYVFGIGPALVTGIVYALIPHALQRIVFAPLYGVVATWAFFEIAGLVSPGFSALGQSGAMWLIGGVAALGCAAMARLMGWTPKHDGG